MNYIVLILFDTTIIEEFNMVPKNESPYRYVKDVAVSLGVNRSTLYDIGDMVGVDVTQRFFNDEEWQALVSRTPLKQFYPFYQRMKDERDKAIQELEIATDTFDKTIQSVKDTFEQSTKNSIENNLKKDSDILSLERKLASAKRKIKKLEDN